MCVFICMYSLKGVYGCGARVTRMQLYVCGIYRSDCLHASYTCDILIRWRKGRHAEQVVGRMVLDVLNGNRTRHHNTTISKWLYGSVPTAVASDDDGRRSFGRRDSHLMRAARGLIVYILCI